MNEAGTRLGNNADQGASSVEGPLMPKSTIEQRGLPGAAELQRHELARILDLLLRVRWALLLFAAAFVLLVVVLDPQPWKVVALGFVLVFMVGVAGFDFLRARRRLPQRLASIPFDLALGVIAQTSVIWLTGGIESPWLVVYLPLAGFGGVLMVSWRARVALMGLMSAALWLMVLSGLYDWTPQATPAFLGLEQGFAQRSTYVFFVAGVMQAILVPMNAAGAAVRGVFVKTLEQALEARQQRLDELTAHNRELGLLSAAIAHELKNPLASIHGLVQLLQRGSTNGASNVARDQRRLDVLGQEVQRLSDTLEEFLTFSRPLGPLSRQAVDVDAMIDELALLHEPAAARQQITLRRPAEPSDQRIDADPRKLKQALINLLQNALAAQGQGGEIRFVVELHESPAEPLLLLGVEDEGPGIAADESERLVEAGVTTKAEGSGIGLALARGIARQHGGELRLERAAGGGCLATLALPMATIEEVSS